MGSRITRYTFTGTLWRGLRSRRFLLTSLGSDKTLKDKNSSTVGVGVNVGVGGVAAGVVDFFGRPLFGF